MIGRAAALLLGVLLPAPVATAGGDWGRTFLDEGKGTVAGLGVGEDGHVVLAGTFVAPDSIDGHPLASEGGDDVFLARFDPAGRCDWAKRAGGRGDDRAVALAVAPGGVSFLVGRIAGPAHFDREFLPGLARGESFLARYEATGVCSWVRKIPGGGDSSARAVAVGRRRDVLVVGTRVRSFSRGGEPEIYLAKFGAAGSQEWIRKVDGSARALDVAVDDAGVTYVAASVPPDRRGGPVRDGWPLVASFDPEGGALWRWIPEHRASEDEAPPWGRPVAVVAIPEGGCYVLGEIRGLVRIGEVRLPGIRDVDVFLARLLPGGELDWTVRMGGPEDDRAFGAALSPQGGCVITGSFRGTARFRPWEVTAPSGAGVFLARYDTDGNCREVRVGTGSEEGGPAANPWKMAVDGTGATLLTGRLRESVRLGDVEISPGRDRCFLARLAGSPGER